MYSPDSVNNKFSETAGFKNVSNAPVTIFNKVGDNPVIYQWKEYISYCCVNGFRLERSMMSAFILESRLW